MPARLIAAVLTNQFSPNRLPALKLASLASDVDRPFAHDLPGAPIEWRSRLPAQPAAGAVDREPDPAVRLERDSVRVRHLLLRVSRRGAVFVQRAEPGRIFHLERLESGLRDAPLW